MSEVRGCMRPMAIVMTTIVLDAPDLEAESSFRAALSGGPVGGVGGGPWGGCCPLRPRMPSGGQSAN